MIPEDLLVVNAATCVVCAQVGLNVTTFDTVCHLSDYYRHKNMRGEVANFTPTIPILMLINNVENIVTHCLSAIRNQPDVLKALIYFVNMSPIDLEEQVRILSVVSMEGQLGAAMFLVDKFEYDQASTIIALSAKCGDISVTRFLIRNFRSRLEILWCLIGAMHTPEIFIYILDSLNIKITEIFQNGGQIMRPLIVGDAFSLFKKYADLFTHDNNTMFTAIAHDRLHVVKYLMSRRNYLPFSAAMMAVAVQYRNLTLLHYIVGHIGIPERMRHNVLTTMHRLALAPRNQQAT